MKLAALIVESLIWLGYGTGGYTVLWLIYHAPPVLAVLGGLTVTAATYLVTRPLQRLAHRLWSHRVV